MERAWLVLFLAYAAAASAAVRVALIGDAAEAATATVIDLATDRLSTRRGIELLDRQETESVLKEQGIALSGLADPEQACAAGVRLGVELLAVIESAAGQGLGPPAAVPGTAPGSPVGLVVYGPKHGLRLWDAALPATGAESAADAVAAGVSAALDRPQRLGQGGRCLALLGVRNADLPREMDSLCAALATLLERQLLRFPDMLVLDRGRPVPDALDGALRDSLRTVQVELSRGDPPDTVRATALLSDANAKVLGSCTALGRSEDLPGLVRALAEELARNLKTTPAEGTIDRILEAQRYASAAARCTAQRDRAHAVAAAEVAFALDRSLPHAKLLSRLLLLEAVSLVSPGPKDPPTQREDVLRCLGRTQRAIDLRAELMQTVAREQPEAIYAYRGDEDPTFNDQLAALLARVNQLTLGEPSLGETEAGPVRAAAVGFLRDGIEQLRATVAAPEGSFAGYTLRASSDLADIARVCTGPEEYTRSLLPALRAWLDLMATLPPERVTGPDSSGIEVNRMLDLLLSPEDPARGDPRPADQPSRQAAAAAVLTLVPAMRQHPHPTVRLYAELVGLVSSGPPAEPIPAARDTRFALGVVQALRAALEAPAPGAAQLIHTQAYYAAVAAATAQQRSAPEPAADACLGIWRLMLERREVVPILISRGLGVLAQGPAPPDALALLDRTLDLCEQRDLYLGPQTNPIKLKADLLAARARLAGPTAPAAGAAAAWCEAKPILEVAQMEDTTTLRQCFLADGSVYGVALRKTEALRPFRLDLDDAHVQWLAPAQKLIVSTPEIPLGAVSSRPPCISSACLGPEHLVVGTLEQGAVAFPLKGGAPVWLDAAAGLPANYVRALACLEGKLYLSLGESSGYLVAVDLQTRQVDVLASSQRQEQRSPLDGAGRLTITHLAADSARRQLLVGVLTGPRQGLWRLDLPSGVLERLFTGRGPDWGSPVRDHTVLFENYRTTVVYDLVAKAPRLIRASTRFRELPGYDVGTAPLKDIDMHPGPQALSGDWLWVPRPLSRISLTTGAVQVVPPLGTGEGARTLNPATLIEPLTAGQRVLVGDGSGLWVLTPNAEPGR